MHVQADERTPVIDGPQVLVEAEDVHDSPAFDNAVGDAIRENFLKHLDGVPFDVRRLQRQSSNVALRHVVFTA